MSKQSRKESHNVGTHKEKMSKRKAMRDLRRRTITLKTGKYIPSMEDEKHQRLKDPLTTTEIMV